MGLITAFNLAAVGITALSFGAYMSGGIAAGSATLGFLLIVASLLRAVKDIE